MPRILMFSQPACFMCELTRLLLTAKEAAFEERDISTDDDARRLMMDEYEGDQTPTVVFYESDDQQKVKEVIIGFDPARLDQLIDEASSSGSVSAA